MMTVRRAVISDCSAISSAYLASWRAGYRDLLPPDKLEIQARVRSERNWDVTLSQPDRVVFVAEDEVGRILGVVECEHRPAPGRLPWLQMLYVVPSAWGTGAAVDLLRAALDAVHNAGHASVWLRVVDLQSRARRFYEREGFVVETAMNPGSNGLFDLIYYRHDVPGP
jgi:GNAT superfamily N-acetyltransferase